MKRIAYLGPEGTVSHESTHYFLNGHQYEEIPYQLISDVFMSTVRGETDWSVIPIENTIDGSVNPHLDFLVHEVELPIQAEWVYPSIQHLIGFGEGKAKAGETAELDSTALSRIRKIISIPVAIAQCHNFIKKHLPDITIEHVSSTAEGVRRVREQGDDSWAAIGTATAANIYGLDLLATQITDHRNNFTRFILVGSSIPKLAESTSWKTTILVTLPEDYPGALHQVLSAFAWRRINLSKIESRPTKLQLGSYFFYIDIEERLDSVLLPAAIEEIKAIGCHVRILGSYPSYSYNRHINI